MYQARKFRKKVSKMKLKDLTLECKYCNVRFTPDNDRAKLLMETKGVVNESRECTSTS